jgi:putative ABC transport system permease protein
MSLSDFIRRDLRLSLRSILRSRGFAIAAVLSLALGIGAAAAAFSVLDAVRFRALPFADGDRLVLLSEVPVTNGPPPARRGPGACRRACAVSYATFSTVLRDHPFRALDAVAGYASGAKVLNLAGDPEPVIGGVVSPNIFSLLGVKPIRGRVFTADDDRLGVTPVVVLSHDLWTTRFGADPGMLGRIVKLSDTQYTVIGIMPPGFEHESGSKFWLAAVPTLDPSTRPSIRSLTVIGRLRRGATIDQLRGELATIEPARAPGPQTGPALRLETVPLRERYTEATASNDVIFAAVVACVLLIACANLANLVLVRTLHQQRDLAIRAALGAGTGRLTRELLVQHIALVIIAAALGLLFAQWLLHMLEGVAVLNSLRPVGMEYRVDLRVIAFATVLSLGIGLLLSAVPARIISRVDIQQVLRASGHASSGGRGGSRAQRLFVVAQIASAVVLLTGGGLMTRTMLRLARIDLGFDADRVAQGTPSLPHTWRVKEKFVPLARQMLDELARLPGASAVALRAQVPFGATTDAAASAITLEGSATPLGAALAPQTAFAVSPGYFRALGVRVVRGREIAESDQEHTPPVALVNEWAARRWWPGADPVGRTFRVDTAAGKPMTVTVIGIVRDNKAAQPSVLLAGDAPEVYVPFEQAPSAFPTYFVRTEGAPSSVLRPMRDVLVRLVPDRPTFSSLLSEGVATQLRGVRTNAMQVLGFALVGLVLALIGVHGVLSYTVGQRTRELGIRGALGATRTSLGAMVLAGTVRLALAGLAIGLPIAVLATRLVGGLLYGTSPTDPIVYAAVGVVVLLVAMLASWIPARRAARVDPLVGLRSD